MGRWRSRRKTLVQSFYLDLVQLEKYWSDRPMYHHTAPVSMVYALREALRMVLEEGVEERVRRHAANASALRAGLEALGLRLYAHPDHRLNPLTTVVVPDGVDDGRVRRRLLAEDDIEIGGGLGEMAGRAWRVGLMGDSSRESNVLAFLSALERILPAEGYEVPQGAGVASAQRAFAATPTR
jgi:alanine-glyoxylate transaminase/serine-glyoxylate transaminase/serine-pyruvate transaminase